MSTIKKVTMKSSVEDIKNFLGATASTVKKKDKNLFSRMQYTSNAMQNGEKVSKKDLFDLAKDVMSLLATPVAAEEKTKKTEAKPKSENALKKSGSSKSKTTNKTEDTDTEKSENTEEKSDSKKSSTKKDTKKKYSVKDPKVLIQEQVMTFPETLERDGNKYKMALDIKTIKDLYEALEKGEQFVFANVWTKRQLKQFAYAGGFLQAPKEFEDDLDLAALMYVSDELKVAYAISTTTDGFYVYLPDEFENFYEEEDMGHRYCNTMEYEIYRLVESDED